MTVLETARLTLRELEADDVDSLAQVLSDPAAMRYYPAPFDRGGIADWIAWARASYREHGYGLWAVIRRVDGRFLGDCGPMLQPIEGSVIPEIGYHIVPSEQGHGYATEAAQASLTWVFENRAVDVVCSLVSPENEPSRAVAAKIHQSMREIFWEKHQRSMCLYWSDRSRLPDAAERAP